MVRLKNILILLIIVCFLILQYIYPQNCVFLSLFNIKCPTCGMTRAFNSIIKLQFIQAIKFNILCIPLLFFLIILIYFLISDIIHNSNEKMKKINLFFSKYYIFIIILLICSFIYNNLFI